MIRITASVYYEDTKDPTVESCLDELFYVSTLIDCLLGTKKCWYEKGYSRKQALEHIVFKHAKADSMTIEKWSNQLKKKFPLIIEGVWDGEVDSKICSINFIKKHMDYPKKINLDISITCSITDLNVKKIIAFMESLVKNKRRVYTTISSNGYWNNQMNVFPDRFCVGWMAYVPVKILPSLIPEATEVIPLEFSEDSKGTVIVSTNEIFDGRNKIHISNANDIEIRLLDIGLLPLMTEL
ncbi:immunity 52 family protein [Enterobacter asburiae]|nr:immunity 52 family protein [Enterobacter asburiae]